MYNSLKQIRIGWIPYWNLLPLKNEFMKNCANLELTSAHPKEINNMLTQKTIDLAPCSSICLLKSSNPSPALPIGVASKGEVASVYLGLKYEHEEIYSFIKHRQKTLAGLFNTIKTTNTNLAEKGNLLCNNAASIKQTNIQIPNLKLTSASATSAALSKIFYKLWFGIESDKIDLYSAVNSKYESEIELLIGDEALINKPNFPYIIDLGAAWHELTELPFVFAVWQQSKEIFDSKLFNTILHSAKAAEIKMHGDPLNYLPENLPLDCQNNPIDLAEYWQLIQYRLTPDHLIGLRLFLYLAEQILHINSNADIINQTLTWSEKFHAGELSN